MTKFEQDLNAAARRIENAEPRPILSVRFTGRDKTAAEERADRAYVQGLTL